MRIWRQRGRQRVEAELPIEIAAQSGMQFIESGDRAHDPGRIHNFAKSLQFFRKSGIAKKGLLCAGGQLEKVAEQAVEHLKLFFE